MTEDLHNIDKLFKSAIDGHEEIPSEKIWNTIDKELDKNNVVSINKKYGNLKKVVIILLLLLFGIITYEWHFAYSSNYNLMGNRGKQQSKLLSNKIGNNYKIKEHINIEVENKSNIGTELDKTNQNIVSATNSKNVQKAFKTQYSVGLKKRKSNNASITLSKKDLSNLNNSKIDNEISFNIYDRINHKQRTAHTIKIKTKSSFFAKIIPGSASESMDSKASSLSNNNRDKENIILDRNTLTYISKRVMTIPVKQNIGMQLITLQHKIPTTLISEVDSNKTINKSCIQNKPPFSIAVFYSPNITAEELFSDDDNTTNNIKNNERSEYSYNYGVLLEYNLNKKWSIGSGVTFIKIINAINPKTIYAQYEGNGAIGYFFDCSSGYSYLHSKSGNTLNIGDSVVTSNSINTLKYIEIPLQIKYTIPIRKFNFHVSIGGAFNILKKGSIETGININSNEENETVNKISGLKTTYISGILEAGIEYSITKKIAIGFNPSVNFAVTSITQNAPVKTYPFFASFAGSLRFSFR